MLAAISALVVAHPIVLFNGKDASAWVHRGTGEPCRWKIVDGALEVTPGAPDIVTKQKFGDYHLHLEFWLPYMPNQSSQGRANSGVYNQGEYEIQILDSWKNPTYQYGGCGAVYGEKDPDAFALQPPETWNRYDIDFTAPKFDSAGNVIAKARITVWQNGIRIHNNYEIQHCPTAAGLQEKPVARGPILLQNHGCAVRFRNIWIVPKDR